MMMVLSAVIFSGSLAVAGYAIGVTVAPKWQRIVDALAGVPLTHDMPLATLAQAERRIAVRRWAAAPRQVPARFHAVA